MNPSLLLASVPQCCPLPAPPSGKAYHVYPTVAPTPTIPSCVSLFILECSTCFPDAKGGGVSSRSTKRESFLVDLLPLAPPPLTPLSFPSARPEPNILLFRRALGTDPVTGLVDRERLRVAQQAFVQQLSQGHH